MSCQPVTKLQDSSRASSQLATWLLARWLDVVDEQAQVIATHD